MINIKEVYRYMGIKSSEEISKDLDLKVNKIIKEAQEAAEFKTVSKYFNIERKEEILNLGFCQTSSKALKKNLCGCEKILLFAATLGMNYERRLSFFSESSPFDALVWHAAGTEILEKKADDFLKQKSQEDKVFFKPRFSPGYGDLPLELQKDIFSALKPEKYIGAYLTNSMLMVPSKTITALAGVCKEKENNLLRKKKCVLCENKNCRYRKED